MVERWLGLAWKVQAGCSLGWGPTAEGQRGCFQAVGIGSFVVNAGLPPAMLARRGRLPTREEIERYFTQPKLRDGPPSTGPSHYNPGTTSVPK
jgi:hypothetical protein